MQTTLTNQSLILAPAISKSPCLRMALVGAGVGLKEIKMKTLRFLVDTECCPLVNCEKAGPHTHVLSGVGVSYLPGAEEVVLDFQQIKQSFAAMERNLGGAE